MAIQDWKTESIRLTPDERNALELLCRRKGAKSKHSLLRALILKEIDPILNPSSLSVGDGLPQVGDPHFKYEPETDTFIWQLDQGIQGMIVLSENVEPTFLKKLTQASNDALTLRDGTIAKLPKGKARIPKEILQYKVN